MEEGHHSNWKVCQTCAVKVVSPKGGRLGSNIESFESITILHYEQVIFAKEKNGAVKGVWFQNRRIIK